jgi:hypothetical protein
MKTIHREIKKVVINVKVCGQQRAREQGSQCQHDYDNNFFSFKKNVELKTIGTEHLGQSDSNISPRQTMCSGDIIEILSLH